MKRHILEFLRRGFLSCGLGPLVLAVIYLILYHHNVIHSLSVPDVCVGVFSLTGLAFIAGGMNSIYQIERLPLMFAISIHAVVLYLSYLLTYFLNDWLDLNIVPVLVFTVIFIIGYLIIWAIIFLVSKHRTERINEILKKKQQLSKNNLIK